MSNPDSKAALPESDEPIAAGSSVDEAAKKKKKKSKKVADGSEETDAAEGGEKMDMDTLCKSIAHLSATSSPGPVSETMIQPHHQVQRPKPADTAGEHAFWGTQPMRKPDGATVSTREPVLNFLLPTPSKRPRELLFQGLDVALSWCRAPGEWRPDRRPRQSHQTRAIQSAGGLRLVHLQHRRRS